MTSFFCVKPGVETFAIQELALYGILGERESPGRIRISGTLDIDTSLLCFPFWYLEDVGELLTGRPVEAAESWFLGAIQGEKIADQWPLCWLTPSDNGTLHVPQKAERVGVQLKKRVSRIAKLAETALPSPNILHTGLFVLETPDGIRCARRGVWFGQRRMRDDPLAPSRSYLKIEEAFALMGCEPKEGELVADLGAAPGGWSWAAAKRGATVWAIDNGPMKRGAAETHAIRHLREDAYRWQPPQRMDWLFCDMIDAPPLVLKNIKKWLTEKQCRRAVINCKYGHTNPVPILEAIRRGDILGVTPARVVCRHLFHDRDEFTMMLEL